MPSAKPEMNDIAGLSYRDAKTGKTHHNKPRAFISPESIPSPAWGYLDLAPYRLPLKGTPFLIVAPVRGCPYSCSFCTGALVLWKKVAQRPVEDVVSEIENNFIDSGCGTFLYGLTPLRATRLMPNSFQDHIVTRKLNIAWTCNSRVDTVDREMLALMKQAGLWMISFGLESGNDGYPKTLKKTYYGEPIQERGGHGP